MGGGGEISFRVRGGDEISPSVLSYGSNIEITYQANVNVVLELRQRKVGRDRHNRVVLPATQELKVIRVGLSDFVGGDEALNLTDVEMFSFSLLNNSVSDDFADLRITDFKIESL